MQYFTVAEQLPIVLCHPMGDEMFTVKQEIRFMWRIPFINLKFSVFSPKGNKIWHGSEESNRLGWQWLGGHHRPILINVKDAQDRNVFIAKRKFFFFYSNLAMFDPKGKQIGALQRNSLLRFKYLLYNEQSIPIAQIKGGWFKSWRYEVVGPNGEQLGTIKMDIFPKGRLVGWLKESLMGTLTFRLEIAENYRTSRFLFLLVAATFCIGLDIFERKRRRNNQQMRDQMHKQMYNQ
jgi:hypothetical protein